jgi:hypothetical protein
MILMTYFLNLNEFIKTYIMDLIRIKKDKIKNEFAELLAKLRRNSDQVPSLEEITKEVESVRKARYEK